MAEEEYTDPDMPDMMIHHEVPPDFDDGMADICDARQEGDLSLSLKLLIQLKDAKDGISVKYDAAKHEYSRQVRKVMALMGDISRIDYMGRTVKVPLPGWSMIPGAEEIGYEWLENNGHSDAIKIKEKSVHHATLSSRVREYVKEHGKEGVEGVFVQKNAYTLDVK